MFSTADLCKLLRSIPEAPEELPRGLRTVNSYDDILRVALDFRATIVSNNEWSFDLLEALHRRKIPYRIDFNADACATRKLVVLKNYPQCPATIFDATHEVMHWVLCREFSNHGEGDAHLAAAEVCFPHRFFNAKSAHSIVATNRMMAIEMLVAWGERWLKHAQIPIVFPNESALNPYLVKRLSQLSNSALPIRLSESIDNESDFDASHLLPELTR